MKKTLISNLVWKQKVGRGKGELRLAIEALCVDEALELSPAEVEEVGGHRNLQARTFHIGVVMGAKFSVRALENGGYAVARIA